MGKDTRHALGDGNDGDYEMSMAHPFEYPRRPPQPANMGSANPEINERRPIARMNPSVGSSDIHEGTAFRTPMGEPYDD